jgi:tetratricopeptide (TPR) repeat protein
LTVGTRPKYEPALFIPNENNSSPAPGTNPSEPLPAARALAARARQPGGFQPSTLFRSSTDSGPQFAERAAGSPVLFSQGKNDPTFYESQENNEAGPVERKETADDPHKTMAMAKLYEDSGRKAFQVGNFKEAATYYREVIRLNPSSAEAHGELALTMVKSGNIPEAITYYKKAIDLNPGSPITHHDLAILLLEQGKGS